MNYQAMAFPCLIYLASVGARPGPPQVEIDAVDRKPLM